MHEINYSITNLDRSHDKTIFTCGITPLDKYLTQQASQDTRRNIAVTYVLTESDSKIVIGYYTLSSGSISVESLPNEILSKLPRYPLLPSTLIGRLAVDKNYHGQKLGEKLLVDALKRSLDTSQVIASMAVIVEAKDDNAVGFYKKYGFTQFRDTPDKLFIPISCLEKLW